MFPIPFYVAMLVSVPEAIIIYVLGLNLINFKTVKLHKIIIISIFHGLFAYLIRLSSIPFGLHTVIQIIELIIILRMITRIRYLQASIAVLIGFFAVTFLELINLPILSKLGVNIQNLSQQPHLIILTFLSVLFISLTLLWIIKRTEFYLVDLNRR